MRFFLGHSFLVALSHATLILAHGGVLSYNIEGVVYNGFVPYSSPTGQTSIQRQWNSYNPMTHTTDSSLACNKNGAALANQRSANVSAGSSVTAYWNEWPHSIGPVMVYMARCPDSCTLATPSSLSWFKIDESGLLSGTLGSGLWGQQVMIDQNNSWTSIIPSTLAPGEYMIRHELLAIHTSNQPQFYPECAQLIVTGKGSAVPPPDLLVKFPGGYSASDPGVTINIYAHQDDTSYVIPGPAVWHG